MKHSQYLLALLLFLPVAFLAQNIQVEDSVMQDPQQRLAHIFEHLDRSQIDPPNLWDEAVDFIDISLFDGTDDSLLFVDTRIFGLAYAGVHSMPTDAANQVAEPTVAYSNEMQALTSTDIIPIMALHHRFNRIKPNAIDDGILYVDVDQLKETAGNTVSPFETRTSFLATPMKRVIHAQTVSFIVKPEHHFGNSGKTLTAASIDFGEGAGWQAMSINTALSHTFFSPGEQSLKIRYAFSDGSSMESRAKIEVNFIFIAPGQPLNGSFSNVYTTSSSSNGSQVDVYVDYNCDADGIRKPLIFVEGFDPAELYTQDPLVPDVVYDIANFRSRFDYDIDDASLYFTNLSNEGYDIIYIDYHDGAIRFEGFVILRILTWSICDAILK